MIERMHEMEYGQINVDPFSDIIEEEDNNIYEKAIDQEIDKIWDKHDVDKSGELDRKEAKCFLEESFILFGSQ